MIIGNRSNCFFGALTIRWRFGGEMQWSHPLLGHWRKERGWGGFFDSPWGHWRVNMPNGDSLSFSPHNKELPIWQQLWFKGHIKRREVVNESR